MKTIPVIYSFARSGGTLVNQLLGVHPDCLVLSEVNPAGSVVPVAMQAADWLGFVETTEVGRFQELPYSQQIALLDARAKSKGKTLIIRDWVTVNYLPGAGGSTMGPSYILEQSVYLARAGYSLQPLVLTRKAKSVYWSIRRNFMHMVNLTVEEFALSYLAYANAVSSFHRISLESLQSAPRETLIQLLQVIGVSIDYVDMQLKTFADFRQCTGNNTLTVPSATSYERHIVQVSQDSVGSIDTLNAEVLIEADRLMGYEL
ncbi:hypothetical protein [Candidatus Methylomirabilis limnetica]|nr:hypothetical protein [Candidatus Methylomirabilis limnetica]